MAVVHLQGHNFRFITRVMHTLEFTFFWPVKVLKDFLLLLSYRSVVFFSISFHYFYCWNNNITIVKKTRLGNFFRGPYYIFWALWVIFIRDNFIFLHWILLIYTNFTAGRCNFPTPWFRNYRNLKSSTDFLLSSLNRRLMVDPQTVNLKFSF